MTDRAALPEYDWRIDAYLSWELAIAELRKRGLRDGKFQPMDDEERRIADSHHRSPRGGGRAP
jgi:hypothetical protein